MKILIGQTKRSRAQRGSAVILFLGLISIMLICVAVNTVTIRGLDKELKIFDQKQVKRWRSESAKNQAAKTPETK
jgi:hypothetical protein